MTSSGCVKRDFNMRYNVTTRHELTDQCCIAAERGNTGKHDGLYS